MFFGTASCEESCADWVNQPLRICCIWVRDRGRVHQISKTKIIQRKHSKLIFSKVIWARINPWISGVEIHYLPTNLIFQSDSNRLHRRKLFSAERKKPISELDLKRCFLDQYVIPEALCASYKRYVHVLSASDGLRALGYTRSVRFVGDPLIRLARFCA